MIRLALKSALSDRASSEHVLVDERNFELPKTKTAVAVLDALGVEGRVLLVVDQNDLNTWKSFANLDRVHVISPDELNAYDVLVNDWVVFTKNNLPDTTSMRNSEDSKDESSES
jgi:large subunit ribosomal protein L4